VSVAALLFGFVVGRLTPGASNEMSVDCALVVLMVRKLVSDRSNDSRQQICNSGIAEACVARARYHHRKMARDTATRASCHSSRKRGEPRDQSHLQIPRSRLVMNIQGSSLGPASRSPARIDSSTMCLEEKRTHIRQGSDFRLPVSHVSLVNLWATTVRLLASNIAEMDSSHGALLVMATTLESRSNMRHRGRTPVAVEGNLEVVRTCFKSAPGYV
jgi:hypothetical protein